jgi:hypothetical protein
VSISKQWVDNNKKAVRSYSSVQYMVLLSRHPRKSVLVQAFVCVVILTIHNKVSAQTVSLNVVNTGWLPVAVQIIDTLCNVTIYQGNIVGNAQIATRACVNRDGQMELILIDLSRRQSYRFTGSSPTINLRIRAS